MMCRVLGVSRSGYYAAERRGASRRAHEDQRLRREIRAIHHRSRQRYGSPRVHAELKAQGIRCARKRVERLMREAQLRGRYTQRRRAHPRIEPARERADNHLERRFTAQGDPDRIWVSDLTYIPTREGWLYLAVVLDLASRRVVGWSMKRHAGVALVMQALEMALQRRQPPAGVLHHSDQGVQYTAASYQALLQRAGMRPSLSRRGNCYDNAVAESFFATLEKELLEGSTWRGRNEARAALFEYIEVWYNRNRRHSSLGYVSPAEFEARLASARRVP
jgi:putative transposase